MLKSNCFTNPFTRRTDMQKTSTLLPAVMAASAMLVAGSAQADVVLSTDLSGTSYDSGTNTLSDITWTTDGVSAPASSLTAVLGSAKDALTGSAPTGFLVGEDNVGSGGSWSTSFSFDLTGDDLNLTSIEIDYSYFQLNGTLQSNTGLNTNFTVTVTGSSSGVLNSTLLAGQTLVSLSPETTGTLTYNYATALDLNGLETYTVEIAVTNSGVNQGTFAGVGGITLNATPVPEPGSLALLGLGGLLIARRRRD